MAATPKKLVHWNLHASPSQFGSPFSDTASSESTSSTSSLQYVNSQLVAHGFTHSPGLSLDGLGKDDMDRVVKCLLSMLGQRVDDIFRSEEMTTRLRTLSYDYERMVSMHRAAMERAANAEREMNLHKARLTAMSRSLQSVELAHKHTTAELQRTRNLLQGLRSTHNAEIKKLEKEKERVFEKWSKLSDSQLKAATSTSGMKCANLEVVESTELRLKGKGQNLLEIALDQAEQARKDLFDQQRRLRGLIVTTANELQRVVHSVRGEVSDSKEEPVSLTSTTLFPLAPVDAAADTLTSLITSIKEATVRLSESVPAPKAPQIDNTSRMNKESQDVERLQAVIDALRAELEQAQKQSTAYASQAQAMFDRFTEDERLASNKMRDMSADSITSPMRDDEKQLLESRFKELEEERKKFTEAAVKLGKEKVVLESERLKFVEEKRSWQVEKMLAELPPTPVPAIAEALTQPLPNAAAVATRSPRRSPRKSSHKTGGAGARGARKTRASRRSSGFGGAGPSKSKVIPSFETEVIPSPSFQPPNFKTSMESPQPQPPALPSAFMIPPPSPAAKLPSQQSADVLSQHLPPLVPGALLPKSSSDSALNDVHVAQPVSSLVTSASVPDIRTSADSAIPETPGGPRPFPMAKPLVARMIHAYSPAKPSPLSRILMLSNSPDSPKNGTESEVSPTPAPLAVIPPLAKIPAVNFDVDDKHVPPRESNSQREANAKPGHGKGTQKPKAQLLAAGTSRTDPLEKENKRRAKSSSGAGTSSRSAPHKDTKKSSLPSSNPVAAASRPKADMKLPPGKGGARRVPINSAEAPVGRGWKA